MGSKASKVNDVEVGGASNSTSSSNEDLSSDTTDCENSHKICSICRSKIHSQQYYGIIDHPDENKFKYHINCLNSWFLSKSANLGIIGRKPVETYKIYCDNDFIETVVINNLSRNNKKKMYSQNLNSGTNSRNGRQPSSNILGLSDLVWCEGCCADIKKYFLIFGIIFLSIAIFTIFILLVAKKLSIFIGLGIIIALLFILTCLIFLFYEYRRNN